MNTCYNPFSLKGKKILVTGASSGIGQATAIVCSRLGAQVYILARNEDRLNDTLAETEGEGHRKYIIELTDSDAVKSLVKEIGEIDGAVLCAGKGDTTPTQFGSKKRLAELFDINFFSQIELISALLKKKCLKRGSSVVGISSVAGYNNVSLGNGGYGATKAAFLRWIKYLAKEYLPKGIRFNALCPGMVETPLIQSGTFDDDQLKKDASRYIYGRYGKPEEIAYAAAYFLSDASVWVTGTQLVLDGGVTIAGC